MRAKTIKRKNLESVLKKSIFQDKFCLEEIKPVCSKSQNASFFEEVFYPVDDTYSIQVTPDELQAYILDVQAIFLKEDGLISIKKPGENSYSNSKRIKKK